jgi:putative Mg2+ transporter-C (MgtC) family protein
MSSLSHSEILLRLAMAFLAGFIVGWERERHGRPAGLRTNILACLASAVAMVLSEVLFVRSAAASATGSWRPDPARLGAGVLTGIGFLGAGTILRHENVIWGVTTAASLWFVTILGLAFGSGEYVLGFLGLGLAMITLYILPRFEKNIESDRYATLHVVAGLEGLSEEDLKDKIKGPGLNVQAIRVGYDLEKKQKTFTCDLALRKSNLTELSNKLVAELSRSPGVLRVRWL